MLDFISMLADFWKSIFFVFDSHPLNIGGIEVSLTALIFAFLVIGFAISYFWKGAKT